MAFYLSFAIMQCNVNCIHFLSLKTLMSIIDKEKYSVSERKYYFSVQSLLLGAVCVHKKTFFLF